MDGYRSFSHLAEKETAGTDYTIVSHHGRPELAVMAIHGGGIEPGTAEIAEAVAGEQWTFYAFKGLKSSGNAILHISSNGYDEPQGLRIATRAVNILSIHGCRGNEEAVYVGGRDLEFKKKVVAALNEAGFSAVFSDTVGQRGIDPHNICNRCRSGKGVQLEISRGLRDAMFAQLKRRRSRERTPVFAAFVACLKEVLATPTEGA